MGYLYLLEVSAFFSLCRSHVVSIMEIHKLKSVHWNTAALLAINTDLLAECDTQL